MEPKTPNPEAAVKQLASIPEKALALSDAFRAANQTGKLFPTWREDQIRNMMRYVVLYASDLNETFAKGRLDSLAQAMRNVMELLVWIRYCELSEDKAKRFYEDGVRDACEMLQALYDFYSKVNNAPEETLKAMLANLKGIEALLGAQDYDGKYLRIERAAMAVEMEDVRSVLFKAASKFSHPTSLLLGMEDPLREVQNSFYEGGASLAVECLRELEASIRTKYPALEVSVGSPSLEGLAQGSS